MFLLPQLYVVEKLELHVPHLAESLFSDFLNVFVEPLKLLMIWEQILRMMRLCQVYLLFQDSGSVISPLNVTFK
jgi:hypothetical protein